MVFEKRIHFFDVRVNQGDQIGRIFAHCAIVDFLQFLGNEKVAHIFMLPFPTDEVRNLILTKNVLGYILGDFFKNSSGHPGVNSA
jgi:hypothetical protein